MRPTPWMLILFLSGCSIEGPDAFDGAFLDDLEALFQDLARQQGIAAEGAKGLIVSGFHLDPAQSRPQIQVVPLPP